MGPSAGDRRPRARNDSFQVAPQNQTEPAPLQGAGASWAPRAAGKGRERTRRPSLWRGWGGGLGWLRGCTPSPCRRLQREEGFPAITQSLPGAPQRLRRSHRALQTPLCAPVVPLLRPSSPQMRVWSQMDQQLKQPLVRISMGTGPGLTERPQVPASALWENASLRGPCWWWLLTGQGLHWFSGVGTGPPRPPGPRPSRLRKEHTALSRWEPSEEP